MNLILIPVYNDYKSLNKLLLIINSLISKNSTQVLIVDDCSSNKMKLDIKKMKMIKKIEILRLSENIGSQKAIAASLKYLNEKKNRDFNYITIMDGDGEDNPNNISLMLDFAKKNKDSVVVSCRKDRNENFLIKFGYKIHLFLTFIFTIQWMSFGNFSCFYYKNLKKILSNKSIWHAYSAAIKKNTNISRVYAARSKRFYGKSKVRLNFLINHSFKIIGVFYKRVIFFSIIYIYLVNNYIHSNAYLLSLLIMIFNIIIILAIYKNRSKKKFTYILQKIK